MPDELLYEAHSALVPWAKDDDHYALHFIIEGRNCDIFLCQGDDDELAFWQALASMWERAPLMQLRLKEARDAIATLSMDALGTACDPMGEGLYNYWYIRDGLLGNIARALTEEKGE